MNKFVKLTMLIVIVATIGCSKTTDLLEGTPITITGEIAPIAKAAESGFEMSDTFSAYIAESGVFDSNVKYKNMKYTKNATGWSPASALYWRDGKQNIWIWGIYPYQTTAVTSALTFTVQQDQSTRESETKMSGYESSDFLLAYNANVAPTQDAIPLTFTHVFSKISIELASTDIPDITTGAVVKIGNVKLTSTIDLSTKTVAVEEGSVGIITACDKGNAFHAAIVQPSGVTDLKFSVEIGGMLFEKSFGPKTFQPGKQYNFKLTLKNGSMSIHGGDIGEWLDGGDTNTEIKPF